MFAVRYSAYQGFKVDNINLVKLAYGAWWKGIGLELIFTIAPAASKTTFASKVVKFDSKIIISIRYSKSMTKSVEYKRRDRLKSSK